MNQQVQSSMKNTTSAKLLQTILEEVKLLRSEVSLLLPEDDLKDYSYPARVKRSYEKALKRYPPVKI